MIVGAGVLNRGFEHKPKNSRTPNGLRLYVCLFELFGDFLGGSLDSFLSGSRFGDGRLFLREQSTDR